MKNRRAKYIKATATLLCLGILTVSAIPTEAKTSQELRDQAQELQEESNDLNEKQADLQEDLDDINEDISDLEKQVADVETDIEKTTNNIEKIKETLAIAEEKQNKQYDAMKVRIRYMYENDDETLLEMLLTAKDMQDFLNKADFIENISDYDREQLQALIDASAVVQAQKDELDAEKASLKKLEDELNSKEDTLETKAESMSANILDIKSQIKELKEKAAKKEEEAAKKAAEEAAKEAAENGSSGSYNYPSGSGVLTKSKGVNYFNGNKETWYSQKVLPGGGLKIPGRHVRSDGVICDGDGYVCVANIDNPKGTVIQTSLGAGKVYDTGCDHGVVDIYVDW